MNDIIVGVTVGTPTSPQKLKELLEIQTEINTALEQAKASGEFDGEKGEKGQRGTGLLPVTTAPSSYTTAVNGLTPAYRISLSTVKSQASATEVYAGDTVRYSYYHYPVIYVDSSYVYCGTRVSIRGSTGAAGAAGKDGKTAYQYAQDGGYTGTEEEFAQKLAAESCGYVAQPNPPADTNVLWIDTDDTEESGGGVDVTAEVGQTIIVKAVDANGKPTEWESADYQPRTHYDGIDYSLLCISKENVKSLTGSEILTPTFAVTSGKKYRITVDSNAYEATAYIDTNGLPTIGASASPDGNGWDFSVFPFSVFIQSNKCRFAYHETGSHEVVVEEAFVAPHKIDRKYIHTPDWNAKANEDGNILNRTHYTDIVETTVLFENTAYYSSPTNHYQFNDTVPLVDGKTYGVVFDGMQYICTCFIDPDLSGIEAVGAKYVYDADEFDFTDYPFYAEGNEDFGYLDVRCKDAGYHTIRISEIDVTVHRLDEKYLPLLTSPSGKKYLLTVSDSGAVSAREV